MSYQRIDEPSANGCEICPSRQVEDFYAQSLRVQVNGHRYRELSGFGIELRANVGHLTNLNATQLDRRAGRQAATESLKLST